jgi:hypothetical protein
MSKAVLRTLGAALMLLVSSAASASADTRYDPYFSSINRCVGGTLIQSGMSCIYAFAACEGVGASTHTPEARDVHMALTCQINPDGTCPAAFECARDHGLTHVGGVYDAHPRACSRGSRNVECRWGVMLQR